MELSYSLLDHISRPSCLLQDLTSGGNGFPKVEQSESISWEYSSLNPKNRVDSLSVEHSQWQVSGATQCGRQYYIFPKSTSKALRPLRVDVFIPDQTEIPIALCRTLQTSWSVCLRDGATIADLGISRHLSRALDFQCKEQPDFVQYHQSLPFGSKLVFNQVDLDVAKMELNVVQTHHVERSTLSLATLKQDWANEVSMTQWPETLDFVLLRLISEIQDSISLVEIEGKTGQFIFKSSATEFRFLYHELKFLLTTPPHPHIMGRPLFIVTKKSNFGGKRGVYGFILPYYSQGSIRDVLPACMSGESLKFECQKRWSCQLTSALIHIREQAGTFYSDLRPDNILLSYNETEKHEDLILCDFEQRGNWYEWCAPEIYYRVYLENLRINANDGLQDTRWKDVVERYSPGKAEGLSCNDWIAANCPHGRFTPWFAMSPEAQEAAEVFTLGLVIYCIFEGVSNVRTSLVNAWPRDPEISFATFRHTSLAVQEIIKKCTMTAPEWESEDDRENFRYPQGIVRIGDRLYIAGRESEDRISTDDVVQSAKAYWERELHKAEAFLGSEDRAQAVLGRPKLREVLSMLEQL